MTASAKPNSYSTREAFEVYGAYIALGRHFTSSYDYHKYGGKIKLSADAFTTRRDAFQFHKLSKDPDWFDILLANFVKNPKVWIGECLEDSGRQTFLEWRKRNDSLTRCFETEIAQLDESSLEANFAVSGGQHPLAMRLFMQKKLSPETFAILTHVTNVLDYWDLKIVDRVLSKDIIRLSRKYYPFLRITDRKRFSRILLSKYK